jgi:hypothetical protein
MNPIKKIAIFLLCAIICTGTSSCRLYSSVFGPKYGCPSSGRNAGAERLLSGEKIRTPKFKS